MNKQITVEVRQVYGHPKYYPLCDDAKTFARIADTKTLTPDTVKQIKKLGYTVQVQTAIPETL